MLELGQAAPQIAVAIVIVAAVVLLMREMRKLSGNGKLAEVAAQVADNAKQLGELREDVAFIRGRLDAAAGSPYRGPGDTGGHRALEGAE